MTHGLDTSVVVRIISGLPEGAAENVGERIAAEIAEGNDFAVSALVTLLLPQSVKGALQHHYAFTKEEALQSLLAFSRTDGIRVAGSIRATLASPNLAKANPGFVDRMIVGEYATTGSDTYSCEKSFRRLAGTVVIPG